MTVTRSGPASVGGGGGHVEPQRLTHQQVGSVVVDKAVRAAGTEEEGVQQKLSLLSGQSSKAKIKITCSQRRSQPVKHPRWPLN